MSPVSIAFRWLRPVLRRSIVAASALLAVAGGPRSASSTDWPPSYWSGDFAIPAFDGPTYACAIYQQKYVVAGEFQWAGEVRASNVAVWTGMEWAQLGEGLPSRVYQLAGSPLGLLAATDSYAPGISPVMAFGGLSWHRVGSDLNGIAEAIYADGPDVYAAGQLWTAGLESEYRVMRWNGSVWLPVGDSFDGPVLAMHRFGNDLYAGGRFLSVGGTDIHQITRWDGTAWREAGNPTGVDNGTSVAALEEYEGRLVAGGAFTTIGGAKANGIAAWNGSAWEALPGTPSTMLIQGLEAEGSLLHVAGVMQEPNQWGSGLVTFDGSHWTLPDWYPSWGISDVAVGSERLIAVGFQAHLANGVPANEWRPNRHVLVRDDFWHDLAPWRPGMRGLLGPSYTSVLSLQEYRGEIIAGGYFQYAADPPGWKETGGVARWNGSVWQPLGEVVQGYGYEMARVGGRLIVGSYGLQTTNATAPILAWDGETWSAPGGPLGGTVTALTEWDGRIVAGGGFYSPVRTRVVIERGSRWESLGAGFAASSELAVQDLASFRGELFVAGYGFEIPGAGTRAIARWNGTDWEEILDTPFALANCLLATDEALYVGTADHPGHGSVWRWDGESWAAVGDLSGNVTRLLAAGGDLYASGAVWSRFAPTSLSRWDGKAWNPIPDAPNRSVEALAALGADLYVGGWFTRAGDRQAEAIARWSGIRQPPAPRMPMLAAPWPSPARDQVRFRFTLERPGRVELTLHDLRGAVVARPVDQTLEPGTHESSWRIPTATGRVPAGIYFARLVGPDGTSTAKVVVAP